MPPDLPIHDVESIYAKAVEFSDFAARDAFLEATCQYDEQLKRRVERLLAAHDQRGDFLSSRGVAQTAVFDHNIEERLGTYVGPYKLLEEIGEGGMGVVYMAEQTKPVRRRVALKIIKPGMDTRQVIARFEAERQALALMDHPNIARVLDAGATDSGHPYFVLELIRGLAITEYCDRERLPIRDRLELFILVCRAVQHAHQKGVIHRDLKPSNVMVTIIDGMAVPKIIDFGVAKATGMSLTERTLVTGFHQFIGTPLYMSPEQANLSGVDVDTRSDIYALGVLLYELLTGTTPIEDATFREAPFEDICRIIREAEPPRPSARVSTLDNARLSTASDNRRAEPLQLSLSMRDELDWIVMKALEKDRQRRYESAGDLAADVSRYLNDEPVDACPPSRRYRLEKFARRHRAALVTTSAVMAALLVGAGIAVWQAVRATTAEREKDVALQQARRAVDDMYTKVAEKWLVGQGSLTDVQRELLESALAFYQSSSATNDADPELRFEKVRALHRVALIHLRLGTISEAEKVLLREVAEATSLVEEYPERPIYRLELLAARTAFATLSFRAGRASIGNSEVDHAVAEANALANASFPTDESRQRLATLLTNLGTTLATVRRFADADVMLKTATRLWQGLLQKSPTKFEYRNGLAAAYGAAGNRIQREGKSNDQAEKILRESIANLTELLAERPDDAECRRNLRAVLTQLDEILSAQGRHEEDMDVVRRLVAISGSLAKDFPNDPRDQGWYAETLIGLAQAVEKSGGDAAEVLKLVKDAHAVFEAMFAELPDDFQLHVAYLVSLDNVTFRLSNQEKHSEAVEVFGRAGKTLDKLAKVHGSRREVTSRISVCVVSLAAELIELGDHKQAMQAIQRYPLEILQPQTGNPDMGPIAPNQRVQFHIDRAKIMLKLAALTKACSTLAEKDQSLSPAERLEILETYSAHAAILTAEADREVDVVVHLPFEKHEIGDAALLMTVWGEQLTQVMLRSKRGPFPARYYWAVTEAERVVIQRFALRSSEALKDDTSQVWIAAWLTTAPAQVRDNDLALRLARRGVELLDSESIDAEFARQTLGWALFRSGQWQACIDTIPKPEDPENDAIVAMALWQLGRRDEARARFAGAETRLRAIKKTLTESELVHAIPASMLWRLHEEAVEMLGAE